MSQAMGVKQHAAQKWNRFLFSSWCDRSSLSANGSVCIALAKRRSVSTLCHKMSVLWIGWSLQESRPAMHPSYSSEYTAQLGLCLENTSDCHHAFKSKPSSCRSHRHQGCRWRFNLRVSVCVCWRCGMLSYVVCWRCRQSCCISV